MPERIIQGLTAGEGIAIGKVSVLDRNKRKVVPRSISSLKVKHHKKVFAKANEQLVEELDGMLTHLDKTSAAIIEAQKQIIMDPEMKRKVFTLIEEEKLSVDYAVYSTFCTFIERLKESGSELFQQRIVDLEDLRDRLVDLVCDDQKSPSNLKGSILVTRELSPTELIAMYENGISGLVMEKGGVTSHAALIAQSLGIPCIVNAKHAIDQADSEKAILDGREGILILEPTREELAEYKARLTKLKRKRKRLLKNAKEPSQTRSGTSFKLFANLEFASEIEQVKLFNAAGVGLVRTEGLLFSDRSDEEDQEQFYREILAGVEGPVVVRLFDVGGDKLNARIPEEKNPFLGWRGIRMLLDEEKLLKSQLRALLKVAGDHPGRIRILAPMISVEQEVAKLKSVIRQVEEELKEEKVKLDEDIPLGIMIEVPSAALIADRLGKHADFFSIGTNDLTQYTLAVDRGNERICTLYQHHHPAVWELIRITVKAAELNDIGISVCGELAGDILGACGLIGLGIRDLSMSPSYIPRVKEELIAHTDAEFEELAQLILNASTTEQIKEAFEEWRKHS